MTQRIPLGSISPDLRFALADAIAHPQVAPMLGGQSVLLVSCLRAWPGAPAYMRYADRDADLMVAAPGESVDAAGELAARIQAVGESGDLDDLGLAVVVLDAVDSCFRVSGLWDGNIYLASGGALPAAMEVAGAGGGARRDPVIVMRELAALELAYLFPVAGKFRSGRYDGQVQFRLNGWGRVLAGRLAVGRTAVRAGEFRRLIGQHLAAERERYASFLRQVDVARQGYAADVLDQALELPIPVLV